MQISFLMPVVPTGHTGNKRGVLPCLDTANQAEGLDQVSSAHFDAPTCDRYYRASEREQVTVSQVKHSQWFMLVKSRIPGEDDQML